jgi:transposase, IS5 family
VSGQIVDASIVTAPPQRNTDDEEEGGQGRPYTAPNWKAKPAKLRHKDRDAGQV